MSKYDDLEKLEDLKQKGTISEEEFEREKTKILNSDVTPAGELPGGDDMVGPKLYSYLMLMHLSQFAGFIIPFLGFIVPIVMWQVNANNPEVDKHGKNIANFMISMLIYTFVSAILCFVLIGIPLLIAIAVIVLVCIIMASVKANQGEYWKYPLSITFFS